MKFEIPCRKTWLSHLMVKMSQKALIFLARQLWAQLMRLFTVGLDERQFSYDYLSQSHQSPSLRHHLDATDCRTGSQNFSMLHQSLMSCGRCLALPMANLEFSFPGRLYLHVASQLPRCWFCLFSFYLTFMLYFPYKGNVISRGKQWLWVWSFNQNILL